MQKKSSMNLIRFDNALIIHNISESISAYQLNAKLGKGTNLPNVSELSKLRVTQENIVEMQQLYNTLNGMKRESLERVEKDYRSTKELEDPKLTKARECLVEGDIKEIEQFYKHLEQFNNQINATIKEGLKAMPKIPTLAEEPAIKEYVNNQKPIPTLAEDLALIEKVNNQKPIPTRADQSAKTPIHVYEIKVDLKDSKSHFAKSNFANNTVINVADTKNTVITSKVINHQGTKTIQDTARQPTQHHKNKPGCCTIF